MKSALFNNQLAKLLIVAFPQSSQGHLVYKEFKTKATKIFKKLFSVSKTKKVESEITPNLNNGYPILIVYFISIKEEKCVILHLIGESLPQEFYLSNNWAIEYTDYLQGASKIMKSIDNSILLRNQYTQSYNDPIIVN